MVGVLRGQVNESDGVGGRIKSMVVEKSRFQCAGINRHEAENGKFLRVRSSDPLGPEFCVGYREVHGEA